MKAKSSLVVVVLALLGCENSLGPYYDADRACTPENNCIYDKENGHACFEGFVWRDSDDLQNFSCVEDPARVDEVPPDEVPPDETPPEQTPPDQTPPEQTPPSTPAFDVVGTATYEDRPITLQGYGPITIAPVRGATVYLLNSAGAIVDESVTSETGSYALRAPAGVSPVTVMLATTSAALAFDLGDCPSLSGCEPALHALQSDPVSTSSTVDLRALASGVGAAFNLFDVLRSGLIDASARFGSQAPPLLALWAPGEAPYICPGASCYQSAAAPGDPNVLWFTDEAENPDGYDDVVALHELGHFLDDAFSHTDNPGGYHDFTPTVPTLAWGEGLATYLAASITGEPLYIDNAPAGPGYLFIDQDDTTAQRNGDLDQQVSELLVATVLWKLDAGQNGTGTQSIYDVLRDYLGDDARGDRGFPGVDLVDFADGYLCHDPAREDLLDTILVDDHRFPYDFEGDEQCLSQGLAAPAERGAKAPVHVELELRAGRATAILTPLVDVDELELVIVAPSERVSTTLRDLVAGQKVEHLLDVDAREHGELIASAFVDFDSGRARSDARLRIGPAKKRDLGASVDVGGRRFRLR